MDPSSPPPYLCAERGSINDGVRFKNDKLTLKSCSFIVYGLLQNEERRHHLGHFDSSVGSQGEEGYIDVGRILLCLQEGASQRARQLTSQSRRRPAIRASCTAIWQNGNPARHATSQMHAVTKPENLTHSGGPASQPAS